MIAEVGERLRVRACRGRRARARGPEGWSFFFGMVLESKKTAAAL